MSERAKIFEALMRHLWCYWMRTPPTTVCFYEPHSSALSRSHISFAVELAELLRDRFA